MRITLQPTSSSAIAKPIIQRNLDQFFHIMTSTLSVLIMAAGKGTRMKSAHPKVLHTLAGRSLLQHVLNAVAGLQADQTLLIVGHGADAVRASVAGSGALCVLQEPQLGTGHAVQQAVPHLPDGGTTLILNGPNPASARWSMAAVAVANEP